MRAVLLHQFGGPEQLYLGEFPKPIPGPEEVLVRVRATALNRADTLQRQGHYPPPPGESPVLGLEMAGEIVALGEKVTRFQVGDAVCGLLGGGGYAEYAVIHEQQALPVPAGYSWEQAAAIPEVFLTAWQALHWLARIQPGEIVLIHAGASGVGTAAIQLATLHGAIPWVTASAGKHELCQRLGAARCIDYRQEDFAAVVANETHDQGIPVIIDFLAASYWEQNLAALGMDGRMVMLALMGGAGPVSTNLALILRKRLHIMGSTLRARSAEYKGQLAQDLYQNTWTAFTKGAISPVIDSVFPWHQVAEAHRRMDANANAGKIVLTLD